MVKMKRKTSVRSYERKDGTKVSAHDRTIDASNAPKVNAGNYTKVNIGSAGTTSENPTPKELIRAESRGGKHSMVLSEADYLWNGKPTYEIKEYDRAYSAPRSTRSAGEDLVDAREKFLTQFYDWNHWNSPKINIVFDRVGESPSKGGVVVDTVRLRSDKESFFTIRQTLMSNGYKRSGAGDGVVVFSLYDGDYTREPFIGMIESDLDGGNSRLSAKFSRASLAFEAARMTVENDPTKRVLLVDLKTEQIVYVELPGGDL
jgi:hypothetical protein